MDDGHIWFELFIIVLLVLGNAVCSLAEIAIVGARKTKLQELADEIGARHRRPQDERGDVGVPCREA